LHLVAYAWLSNGFDWALILRDIGERRAMSVGLLAFALLISLALTRHKTRCRAPATAFFTNSFA